MLAITWRKNLKIFGSTSAEKISPAPTTKNNKIGKNNAKTIDTTARISSRELTTTLDTGSGLAFTAIRVAAFVP
jgi:hypothetical protein